MAYQSTEIFQFSRFCLKKKIQIIVTQKNKNAIFEYANNIENLLLYINSLVHDQVS